MISPMQDLLASSGARLAGVHPRGLRAGRRRHRRLVEREARSAGSRRSAVVALIAAGGVALADQPGRAGRRLFQGAMVVDGVAVFAKVLIALSAAATLALGADHFIQHERAPLRVPGADRARRARHVRDGLGAGPDHPLCRRRAAKPLGLRARRLAPRRCAFLGSRPQVLRAERASRPACCCSARPSSTASPARSASTPSPRRSPKGQAASASCSASCSCSAARLQDVAPRRSTCGRPTSTKARPRRSSPSSPPRRRSPPSR